MTVQHVLNSNTSPMAIIFFFALIFYEISLISSSPNFIIFLADDLGYGDVGCFGNDTISTPNIDKLCEDGVKLNHHLTAAAVCTPSRAAILTGRYPIRSGMESSNRNKVFFFVAASGGLPENETTIAKALKEKKYSTGLIGKWHLGNDGHHKGDALHHPLNHGFDYFYGLPLSNFKDMGSKGESVITSYIPNFFLYITALPIISTTTALFYRTRSKYLNLLFILLMIVFPIIINLFLRNLNTINGILMENKEVIEQPIRLEGLTQRLVAKSIEFLDQQKSPFLLYVSFVHVHTALFCSKEFFGRSKHGSYGDNVEEMDWAVGKIMEKLGDMGMRNRTFVYFSSDNGAHIEEVGANGEREGGFNGIFRGGKTMGGMEGGIRVPSIISWPGASFKGDVNQATSQMDLFPTVLEMANIPLPKDRIIDGKSLVPLLKGEAEVHHEFLFHYCGRHIHAATYIDKQKAWKIHWTTPKFLPGTEKCGYVCHCFGDFVIHHNPPLVYDLTNDPSESKPIKSELNDGYFEVIKRAEEARNKHKSKVEKVPDQFSFRNTVWKPWLQPCCSLQFCKCTDSSFRS